eukprot:snap_masked-scaffold_17-processed-gene-3.7-mRNA-1 protein AED:1.00 eAED:1.00 QI:0/0/0/0/1/1/2/0/79
MKTSREKLHTENQNIEKHEERSLNRDSSLSSIEKCMDKFIIEGMLERIKNEKLQQMKPAQTSKSARQEIKITQRFPTIK